MDLSLIKRTKITERPGALCKSRLSSHVNRQVLKSRLNQFLLGYVCASDLWRRARSVGNVSVKQECYQLADLDVAVDPDRNAVVIVVDAHTVFLSMIPEPFE